MLMMNNKSSSGVDLKVATANISTQDAARLRQSKSPSRCVCVCELCECGSHNCSSIMFRRSSPPQDDNRWPTNNDEVAQENFLDDDADEEPKVAQLDSENELGEQSSQRLPLECRCLMHDQQERYLTRSRTPQAQQHSQATSHVISKRESNGVYNDLKSAEATALEQESPLLHVLVTRPEIAPKPRDNIIFEGDMDLKTTFETSYEALARMRLEQWKKYQELAKSQHQHIPPVHQAADDGDGEKLHLEAEEVDVASGRMKPPNQGIVRQEVSVRNMRAKRGVELQNAADTNNYKSHQHQQQQRPVLADAPSSGGGGHSNGVDIGEKKEKKITTTTTSTATPPTAPQSIQTSNDVISNNNNTNNLHQEPYIDPDLSSIIVYDANMNRLEKVGLRKRSKYRPSTSLRPGARGLFGDQQEEPPAVVNKQKDQVSQVQKNTQNAEQATETTNNQMQLEASTLRAAKPLKSATQRNMSPIEAADAEDANQIELKRNLNKTNQRSSGLVYSQQNLHVESKRRVRDNVNMKDHIKEQNIVEDSNYRHISQSQQTRDLAPQSQEHKTVNRRDKRDATPLEEVKLNGIAKSHVGLSALDVVEDDYEHMVRENLENIKLADREEEEAVKEIQRVTSQTDNVSSHLNLNSNQDRSQKTGTVTITPDHHVVRVLDNSSKLSNQSAISRENRQSKLERTCQNQNFYLYQNDYPIAKHELEASGADIRTPVGGRATVNKNVQATSPTSNLNIQQPNFSRMSYNNLFRESPDFVLTTGKFMELEDKNLTKSSNRSEKQKASLISNEKGVAQQTYDDEYGLENHNHHTDRSYEVTDEIQSSPHHNHFNHNRYGGISGEGLTMQHQLCNCRVLKLNEEFHYVGSQLGHKYFVEKQMSAPLLDEEY